MLLVCLLIKGGSVLNGIIAHAYARSPLTPSLSPPFSLSQNFLSVAKLPYVHQTVNIFIQGLCV